MVSAKENIKPHIKAPRVAPLEGVSTYALRGIGVRGVENPRGFGIDERRFIDSIIQHIFAANADSNIVNSPQRAQSSQRLILHLLSKIGNILPQQHMCVSVSSVHGHVCPSRGIRGCAPQRRDSGRLHLRLNTATGGV